MLVRVAVRNLVRQRSRALLTLASIAFGVASLMLAAGFIDDVLWQLREATIHSQIGHFEVFAPGYVDSGHREPLAHTLEDSRSATALLRSVPGVTTIAPRLSFQGLASNGRADVAVMIDGVEAASEAQIGTSLKVVAGMPLTSASGSLVVGEGVARALKLSIGEPVTLLVATKEGAVNTFDAPLTGIFRSPFKDYDERAVKITLADARQLVGSDSVNALAVLLGPDASVEQAIDTARRALPANRYEIRPWWELADFYQGTAALYRRQFLVLLVIVSLMVVLGVANSISMALHERQSEFGTVRALGYGARHVVRQIILESALLGIAAVLLGIVIGVGLATLISAIGIDMPPPPNSDVGYTATIRLSVAGAALAAAAGLLASVVGAVLPARRLARMPIVEALRHAI